MNALEALDSAAEGFADRLARVADGQWSASTPCDDWDVRFLVAHVVGGNRFAALVLDGMSADSALDQVMSHRQLGDEPQGDFASSSTVQRARFRAEGALRRSVSHPLGDMTGERFLGLRVFDVAVHTWDLAQAIGEDDALDGALADTVLDIVQLAPTGMGFGITPLAQAGPAASARDRLLDLTGRRRR